MFTVGNYLNNYYGKSVKTGTDNNSAFRMDWHYFYFTLERGDGNEDQHCTWGSGYDPVRSVY